jgi:hypothetical protein
MVSITRFYRVYLIRQHHIDIVIDTRECIVWIKRKPGIIFLLMTRTASLEQKVLDL